MRMRRAMTQWYACVAAPGNDASDAELRAQQAIDLAAVGATLRLPHHRPDERADRLRVAAAHAVGDVRVLLDHARDDRGELVAIAHGAQALALYDVRGIAAGGDEVVEHLAPRAAGHAARVHEPRELGQRLRRHVG